MGMDWQDRQLIEVLMVWAMKNVSTCVMQHIAFGHIHNVNYRKRVMAGGCKAWAVPKSVSS